MKHLFSPDSGCNPVLELILILPSGKQLSAKPLSGIRSPSFRP